MFPPMNAPLAPNLLRTARPNPRPSPWRRVVVLCVAVWTAAAFALPGGAAAAPMHAHHAGVVHPAAHCHGAMAHHAPAAGHEHAPGPRHAHHTTCLDCCCASPGAHLPASPQPPLGTASPPRAPVLAAAEPAPRVSRDFLHPFPNGPPSLRA
jgi:hypothetical protein